MRQLKPVNRHLVIIPHTKKNETPSGVMLPEDYSPEEDLYVEATVLAMAEDCSRELDFLKSTSNTTDRRIIVDSSMIREISLKSETFHVVLENYVVGALDQRVQDES
tara:strand:+ start:71 stop:391 length:321 start_codon:yes stop_codon:yes gene_type:complete